MKRLIFTALCLGMVLSLCAGASALGGEYVDDGPPELPPGAGISATPGYTRHEPGHWERTDVLYFGPLEETREVNGVTVKAEWTETGNGKSALYTFTDQDGKQTSYTVESYWFEEQYYADDYFSVGVNIQRQPDTDDAPGGISASLALADVVLGEGEYGFQPDVRSYFTEANGTVIESFSVNEHMTFSTGSDGKYYIDPHGKFPAGETDGQKLYAVLGVQDDLDRGTRMFIAYEYRWVDQPEDIEVPPEYGPIEYFDDPVSVTRRSPLLLIVPAAAVILAVVFLVTRKR